jgi:hypothetical protein
MWSRQMSVGRVVSSSTIRDLRFFRRLAALELEWQRDIDEWRSEEAGHLFPLRNALKWEGRNARRTARNNYPRDETA